MLLLQPQTQIGLLQASGSACTDVKPHVLAYLRRRLKNMGVSLRLFHLPGPLVLPTGHLCSRAHQPQFEFPPSICHSGEPRRCPALILKVPCRATWNPQTRHVLRGFSPWEDLPFWIPRCKLVSLFGSFKPWGTYRPFGPTFENAFECVCVCAEWQNTLPPKPFSVAAGGAGSIEGTCANEDALLCW